LRFWQPSLNHHCEGVEGQSKYQECNREFSVKAAPEQSFESEHPAFDPKNILDVVKNILDAFYRFSRPHTVIGTVEFFSVLPDLLLEPIVKCYGPNLIQLIFMNHLCG
jgi:hypothetical protein